jgi:homocysteine S-methyltransferase
MAGSSSEPRPTTSERTEANVSQSVEDDVVILDGGLATELMARGHDLSDRLWSARLLLTDPDAIEEVHLAYFRAGAQVAITASYQASVEGFTASGLSRAEAVDLIGSSVRLARNARDRFRAEVGTPGRLLVAGSVGPYGAMLADGSEYTGAYDIGRAAMLAFHRPRIDALVDAGADLLAIETIPSIGEAEVIVELLDRSGIGGWLSYSCRDGSATSAGEPIEAAVAIADADRLVAVGVNCTPPRLLPDLLAAAGSATDRPLIAYPNGGDRWDASVKQWIADTGGSFDAAAVAGWTTLGATWLGGCCGTRPGDIRALVANLSSAT